MGGGIPTSKQVYGHDYATYPNYNLMLSVNHPEWVLRWAKYAFPSLPKEDHKLVLPYIKKHKEVLKKHDLYPNI